MSAIMLIDFLSPAGLFTNYGIIIGASYIEGLQCTLWNTLSFRVAGAVTFKNYYLILDICFVSLYFFVCLYS